MSTTPTPPPAGWYPSPDGSATLHWWDGEQWTAHQRPLTIATGIAQPVAPAPSPRDLTRFGHLAASPQILLVVGGLISAVSIGVELFGVAAITTFIDTDYESLDQLSAYDTLTSISSILAAAATIGTAVLWVIWQYRAAELVSGRTRRTPGWHVGSWFVPIVSFWFPYQNISDLWRASHRSVPSWQLPWWLLWLSGGILTQVATRIYLAAEDLSVLRSSMWLSAMADLLLLAAAPLGVLVIRGITAAIICELQTPTATAIPPTETS
ncbi:MAG: DUF4328 domain-containing protein [Microbacterium sp.]